MKRNVRLIALAAVAVLSILGFTLTLASGLKPAAETNGKTMLIATAPYDLDLDSVDRGDLHERLSSVIDVPFTVGLTRNYSHGYPEIIITSLEEPSASNDDVMNTLNAAYPEFDIQAVDRLSFKPSHSRWFYYLCILFVTAAFFLVIVIFFAMSGAPFSSSLKWIAAAALSLGVALLLGKIVGCREGSMAVLISLLSLVASTAVVISSVFSADNASGNKKTTKLSDVSKYAIMALIISAASIAVAFFAGTEAGMTDPLEKMLASCAAVIPSVIVSYVTVEMLFGKER